MNADYPRAVIFIIVLLGATVAAVTPAAAAESLPATAALDGDAVAATALDGDQFEPNDDFASATPVESGTYPNLSIQPGDIDVYAVDLRAGEPLSAEITFSHAAGDLDMALVDPTTERVLAVSDSTTDDESISYVAPEAGTYYLVV